MDGTTRKIYDIETITFSNLVLDQSKPSYSVDSIKFIQTCVLVIHLLHILESNCS